MEDTIVAISTTTGVGAISIVRLSGKDAISIVNKSFKGKNLTKQKSHTITYGHIKKDDEIIDEVLVSIMKAPKSYTTEDVVEINCHGGIISTNKILEIMLENGARLAEPGEFTKRAFLNGRIDLVEAESVMDLIESKTNEERKLSINTLQGQTSNLINKYRKRLIDLLSQIEVNIDYPEYYDIEVVTRNNISKEIINLRKDLLDLIKLSEERLPLKNGIDTLILGKPNVGKSSILNKLLNENKAIVTDIEGTTRDIVEGSINLNGLLLNLIDTAGVRKTDNLVEKIGVEKTIELIDKVDLVILVLNSNEELSEDDKKLLELTNNKTRIIVLNKIDLDKKINLPKGLKNVIETSMLEDKGIELLKNEIEKLYKLEKIKTKDQTYLSNTRQLSLAKRALEELNDAEKALKNKVPIDMIEIDLKKSLETLGEIIGLNYQEEIIDNLFKNFCVGK